MSVVVFEETLTLAFSCIEDLINLQPLRYVMCVCVSPLHFYSSAITHTTMINVESTYCKVPKDIVVLSYVLLEILHIKTHILYKHLFHDSVGAAKQQSLYSS